MSARILEFSIRVAVVTVVLLAALTLALRLMVPRLPGLEARLEAELSELAGHPVTVGELDIRWRLVSARVSLVDVRIQAPEQPAALLEVGGLQLDVNPFASLWRGEPAFGRVRVRDADVHVLRDASGRVRVQGAAPADEATPSAAPTDLTELLAGRRFNLVDSRLRWEDRTLGIDYQFDDLNLAVALEANRLRLAGDVFLPAQLGHALRVGMDLRLSEKRDQWRGRAYLQAQDLQVQGLPREASQRLGLASGRMGTRLWLTWDRGQVEQVHVELEGRELELAAGEGSEGVPAGLEHVAGRLLWEREQTGWRLRGSDVQLERQELSWPEGGFELRYRKEDGGRQLQGHIDYLRLDDIAPLWAHQRVLEHAWQDAVSALAPRGTVHQVTLNLQLPTDAPPNLHADGHFRGVGLSPHGAVPGVRGLEGGFAFTGEEGELWVDSPGLELTLPDLFDHPLWADTAQGTIHWQQGPEGLVLGTQDLLLANEDIQTRARGQVTLGQAPGMDLALAFSEGNGARLAHYLPRGILPGNVDNWVSRAVVEGRVVSGSLLFRGPFAAFPFRDQEGRFLVRARLEDGILNYQEGWPRFEDFSGELIFDNQGMEARAVRGRLSNARVTDARVRIEDLRSPRLDIEGGVQGRLVDYLRYVSTSPLGEGLETWLAQLQVEGEGQLDLQLDIPLQGRDAMERPDQVEGVFTLQGNRLALEGRDLALESIRGQVDFTERTVQAQDLSARFNDVPVTLRLDRFANGELQAEAEGMQSIRALLGEAVPRAVVSRLEGASLWRAHLLIPPESAPSLRLASDLVGVASSLPAPFDKPRSSSRPLEVEIPLGAAGRPLRAYLDGGIQAVVSLVDESGVDESGAMTGELRMGRGAALLPSEGFRVVGRLDQVDVDDWWTLVSDLEAAPLDGAGGALKEVDLHLGTVSLAGGRQTRDVDLHARRNAGHWDLQLASPLVLGQVLIPVTPDDGTPLVMELDLLDLDQLSPGDTGQGPRAPMDPRRLPPLDVSLGTVALEGRRFGPVRLVTELTRDGLLIREGRAVTAGDQLRGRMQGHWTVDEAGQHHTRLELKLDSDDLGRGLTDLGFNHAFSGGRARVEAILEWPDAPDRFDLAALEGAGDLRVRDGRLIELEPGAGRLLGLFSLNLLPRRLALDFRDFFQRGFVFDELVGSFRLSGGNVHTPDLRIEGPAARIRIQGRTGLVDRDYDQTIVVTPSVRGALPLAGALLGGPVAGLAVFVFDRVAGVGEHIDEASRVEYRVTGPWSSPLVEGVARGGE
ncbi:YhdP family protein [Ectothiorhodospira marina]|uniref:TIGR02099 family protein n=1 Tax=Ectothiorhodospira marina TaxID=1396821 RepID=A0A1H7L4M0_9GAMM|nr:YhdP family protein [Ectothiorhodospira marina]SEK94003.1 TIGR02099 family protein [Ectothiorhodospira marina]